MLFIATVANSVIACIEMAYIVMAYMVMAYIVMASIVMTSMVMASIYYVVVIISVQNLCPFMLACPLTHMLAF